MHSIKRADYQAEHFLWQVDGTVATITLNRPERKNPLTFDSYAELRDLFRDLAYADDIQAVVIRGAGGNFCSGGDVHEIIGPLTKMDMKGLLAFTRMTGDLVKAMRACPQPITSAVDGICAGAGAIIAMASDLRYGTPDSKTAFLFTRVGLAGCDMGAYECNLSPAPSFKRGDANADGGNLDISDAVYILQYLFADGPDILCMDAGDANDQGGVDIADAIFILQYLFASGPTLPPPFPDCGFDITPDEVTCDLYPHCP